MSYIKNFTTEYLFGGKTYKITAPARFDAETDQPIYDAELDERATKWPDKLTATTWGLCRLQN